MLVARLPACLWLSSEAETGAARLMGLVECRLHDLVAGPENLSLPVTLQGSPAGTVSLYSPTSVRKPSHPKENMMNYSAQCYATLPWCKLSAEGFGVAEEGIGGHYRMMLGMFTGCLKGGAISCTSRTAGVSRCRIWGCYHQLRSANRDHPSSHREYAMIAEANSPNGMQAQVQSLRAQACQCKYHAVIRRPVVQLHTASRVSTGCFSGLYQAIKLSMLRNVSFPG